VGSVSFNYYVFALNLSLVRATPLTTFINPLLVAGTKFVAASNAVIDTAGSGVNFFPGNGAGSTQTGGQYI
jgi:hypothetical protein